MSRRVKVVVLALLLVACKKTITVPIETPDDAGGSDTGNVPTSLPPDAAADTSAPDLAVPPEASLPADAAPDTGASPDASPDQAPPPPDLKPDLATDASACGGVCVVPFASDSTWTVYRSDPFNQPDTLALGGARPVCLNVASPAGCPAGAFLYGIGPGWRSNLATVPGALWIWSPDVALDKPADLERFVFSRAFDLGASPTGTISVSADDSAEVRVNGELVGTTGSTTDVGLATASQNGLATFPLTPHLKPGRNVISVAAQNGPARFAGCATACTYASNPAGVVFGGTLSFR